MELFYSFFALILLGTEALLFFGIAPIIHASVIPAIPLTLGMATVSGRGRWMGNFLGFTLSYALFQIVISYIMNVAGIDDVTLQKIGILFLVVFGLMMLFPQYAIWKKGEDDYRKAKYYGMMFGFVWSFWAAIPTKTFNFDLNIFVLFILVYFMLVAAVVPGFFFTLIAFILSNLYNEKKLISIEKGVGWLTLLISFLLSYGILKTPTISEKPEISIPLLSFSIFS